VGIPPSIHFDTKVSLSHRSSSQLFSGFIEGYAFFSQDSGTRFMEINWSILSSSPDMTSSPWERMIQPVVSGCWRSVQLGPRLRSAAAGGT
jgi:hypothetical protein